MTKWAVLGGSGFVGSAVVDAIRRRDEEVIPVAGPRLQTSARTVSDLSQDLRSRESDVEDLAQLLSGCDLVINAAGIADPDGPDSDQLFGANALLPAVAARAAKRAGCRRFVHLSSQSAQGDVAVLTETAEWHPFSPYSLSKARGEQLLRADADPGDPLVIFRAVSVQGADRGTTRRLAALARSKFPFTSVDGPTPLALIGNTAAAVVFCADHAGDVPRIVLQPGDGLTTDQALRALGARRVWRIPRFLARPAVGMTRFAGRYNERLAGAARRAELLLFGQAYESAWFSAHGFQPEQGLAAWVELGNTLRTAGEHG